MCIDNRFFFLHQQADFNAISKSLQIKSNLQKAFRCAKQKRDENFPVEVQRNISLSLNV